MSEFGRKTTGQASRKICLGDDVWKEDGDEEERAMPLELGSEKARVSSNGDGGQPAAVLGGGSRFSSEKEQESPGESILRSLAAPLKRDSG